MYKFLYSLLPVLSIAILAGVFAAPVLAVINAHLTVSAAIGGAALAIWLKA